MSDEKEQALESTLAPAGSPPELGEDDQDTLAGAGLPLEDLDTSHELPPAPELGEEDADTIAS